MYLRFEVNRSRFRLQKSCESYLTRGRDFFRFFFKNQMPNFYTIKISQIQLRMLFLFIRLQPDHRSISIPIFIKIDATVKKLLRIWWSVRIMLTPPLSMSHSCPITETRNKRAFFNTNEGFLIHCLVKWLFLDLHAKFHVNRSIRLRTVTVCFQLLLQR